jgi:hypothetical protein
MTAMSALSTGIEAKKAAMGFCSAELSKRVTEIGLNARRSVLA